MNKITLALVLAAAGGAWFAWRKIRAGFESGALDPTSRNNVAYQGVNQVGAALTGDESFSLGGAIWELFNGNQVEELLAPDTLESIQAKRGTQ